MEYHITQYDLEQGALEIQYIEEFFGEFPRKKTAAEKQKPAKMNMTLLGSGFFCRFRISNTGPNTRNTMLIISSVSRT